MNMRVALSIASLLAGAGHVLAQQPTGELPARLLLKEGWLVKSTAEVKEEGEVVSTVLNTLIKRGVYPDLRIGLNSFRIPDASDEFNRRHDLAKYSYLPDKRNPWKDPYWYRTEFGLPEAARGKRAWLNFNGINVWLNGKRIADSQQVAGSFSRYRFDVTEPARAGQNPVSSCPVARVEAAWLCRGISKPRNRGRFLRYRCRDHGGAGSWQTRQVVPYGCCRRKERPCDAHREIPGGAVRRTSFQCAGISLAA